MRTLVRVASIGALRLAIWSGNAAAVEVRALYEAKARVSGQVEATRVQGFASSLEAVLIKVSGDPRVVTEARVRKELRNAARLIQDFSYRDLLAHLPVHDEQGTRDRPYELTVRFAPEKIDALLRDVGRKPWGASRPRVLVVLEVETGATRYVLARDGDRGRDQRESLAVAAERFGVPIALPDQATAGDLALTAVDQAAKAQEADVVLRGRLVWSDKALGWTAAWRLHAKDKSHRWQIRGVNFDAAFRNAMSGALQILSGHGAP